MTGIKNSPLAGKSVLFLINQDLGGGVEYLGQVLGEDLRRRGANCTTRFIYPPGWDADLSKVRQIIKKAKLVAKAAPDVIITFQPTASAVAAVAGRLGGCRVIIAHQSNSPVKSHPAVRFVDKTLGSTGAYTVAIANSRATLSEFDGYPARYRRKIRLIEHGIPPPSFSLSPADIRARFSIPNNGPLLLMAARLDEQKGQCIIVSALPKLPGVRLAMAGSGPAKDRLIAHGKSLGVADRLHFLGHVGRQDLTDLYRASTLMAFPSSWETFGLAAVEAAMAGLPIVSSDIPALREVLADNGQTTTHYVSNRQPDEWATAIAGCLADTTLRPRSEAFASVIQDKYSEKRMMQGYEELYAELFP
ncbi:MAG: glycosyltransferase family 4 protein [Hyphomicrobium sp.]